MLSKENWREPLVTLEIIANFPEQNCTWSIPTINLEKETIKNLSKDMQSDSKLLSEFLWPINGNPDSNLESPCTKKKLVIKDLKRGRMSVIADVLCNRVKEYSRKYTVEYIANTRNRHRNTQYDYINLGSFISQLSLFWWNKVTLILSLSLCAFADPLLSTFECLNQSLWNLVCISWNLGPS
jgi:hypothetical protein